MPEYGKYTEKQLANQLVKIPKEEMVAFHKQRMKKYRWFFIFALICGILALIGFFFGNPWRWIGMGFAIVGIFLLALGSFKRKKWIRIYENMMYLKHQKLKDLNAKNPKKISKFDKTSEKIQRYKKTKGK